jgi:DNA-binding transcriptional MerR regulator
MDNCGNYFTIGEASKLCNVSKKALRYYQEKGMLSPDLCGDNRYQYYSKDTLLSIPIIKYYKQMGFHIDEMQEFIVGGGTYRNIENAFNKKIGTLLKEEVNIKRSLRSIKDWYDLIMEAMTVIESKLTDVGVSFIPAKQMLFLRQPYNSDYKDAIINIEFTNYIESINNHITGPVVRYFDSVEDRLDRMVKKQLICQEYIEKANISENIEIYGNVFATAYHIGSHKNILDTVEKLVDWAEKNDYRLDNGIFERYVTDYWTTGDESLYVTQLLAQISRKSDH